jgi:hypothetical protein
MFPGDSRPQVTTFYCRHLGAEPIIELPQSKRNILAVGWHLIIDVFLCQTVCTSSLFFAVNYRCFPLLFFWLKLAIQGFPRRTAASPAVFSGNNSENSKRQLGDAEAARVNSD